MRTIKLSTHEVDIKESLTWGDAEAIQSVMLGGMKLDATGVSGINPSVISEGKYKLLEICVLEIRNGESKSSFTREWMDNLSIEDGDALYSEVEKLQKKTAK